MSVLAGNVTAPYQAHLTGFRCVSSGSVNKLQFNNALSRVNLIFMLTCKICWNILPTNFFAHDTVVVHVCCEMCLGFFSAIGYPVM